MILFITLIVAQIFSLKPIHTLEWQVIGTGVNHRPIDMAHTDKMNNILITYAGWNVKDIEVKTWSDRLLEKSSLNQTKYAISRVYGVRGPKESNYASKEIQNSKLIEHILLDETRLNKIKLILIIAHSSGSFVADEFFALFYNKISQNPAYTSLRQRIVFYNLDGGTRPSRYDDVYIKTLFSSINFVWASISNTSSSSSLSSMNSATMIAAKNYYSWAYLNIKSVQVVASKSMCLNSKCLHDAVIIQRPWDSQAYDTARDYVWFSENENREVQFDYLGATQGDLNSALETK
jgi:hypothetical protein